MLTVKKMESHTDRECSTFGALCWERIKPIIHRELVKARQAHQQDIASESPNAEKSFAVYYAQAQLAALLKAVLTKEENGEKENNEEE
jgi:hypothetical protein